MAKENITLLNPDFDRGWYSQNNSNEKSGCAAICFFSKSVTDLGNLWINSVHSVPIHVISHFCAWLRRFQRKNSLYFSAFLILSWKRADCPYIRLWRVFARRWQERTNWHRRTWLTTDSRFSSVRDTRFSYSRTDTWWSEMRAPPYSAPRICGSQYIVPSQSRCQKHEAAFRDGG